MNRRWYRHGTAAHAVIHLDSPLRSLTLRDEGLADLVGGATRQVFEHVIDLCLDERVDTR